MNKNVELTRNHVRKLEAKIEELKGLINVMLPLHQATGCDSIVARAQAALGATPTELITGTSLPNGDALAKQIFTSMYDLVKARGTTVYHIEEGLNLGLTVGGVWYSHGLNLSEDEIKANIRWFVCNDYFKAIKVRDSLLKLI
jgi:hypothetical protein